MINKNRNKILTLTILTGLLFFAIYIQSNLKNINQNKVSDYEDIQLNTCSKTLNTDNLLIKKINVNLGVDLSRKRTDVFYDFLGENGHYIFNNYETNIINYDGNIILRPKKSYNVSIYLSKNGLNHGYSIKNENDNTLTDFYINNKKVFTDKDLFYFTIADNGKDFFYIKYLLKNPKERVVDWSRANKKIVLYKNGNQIYDTGFIKGTLNDFWISSNGSNYFLSITTEFNINIVIKNGHKIAQLSSPEYFSYISDSGDHIITNNYKSHNSYLLDYQFQFNQNDFQPFSITNSGDYLFLNKDRNLKISTKELEKEYSLKPETTTGFKNGKECNSLVFYKNLVLNDGKYELPIFDSFFQEQVSVSDNILYFYNFVE